MPGKRNSAISDFVTSRRLYRYVSEADTGGPTDLDIPVLDTRTLPSIVGVSEAATGSTGKDGNLYGRDARIFLYFIFADSAECSYGSSSSSSWNGSSSGAQEAVIEVWALGDVVCDNEGEECDDVAGLARANLMIGLLYLDMDKTQRAKKEFEKSLNLYIELNLKEKEKEILILIEGLDEDD